MPCEWPLIITEPCLTKWDAASPEQREAATATATDILWMLTGRAFGLCTDTARPMAECRHSGTWFGNRGPTWVNGGLNAVSPVNVPSCGCFGTTAEVRLSDDPIHSVEEVWIDGVQLDATAYKVRDGRRLVRVDGGMWPTRQDFGVGDKDVGAFYVEFTRGVEVPRAGQVAAGVLACEDLNAQQGARCRLPRGTTSVDRQGVSVEIDPHEYFSAGLTGIDEVDQWIMAVNPAQLRTPSRAYSVDVPSPSRYV